jgi:hypothetical protein
MKHPKIDDIPPFHPSVLKQTILENDRAWSPSPAAKKVVFPDRDPSAEICVESPVEIKKPNSEKLQAEAREYHKNPEGKCYGCFGTGKAVNDIDPCPTCDGSGSDQDEEEFSEE